MSQNYHKAALGGGLVVLAAVGYFSWSKATSLQEEFAADAAGKPGDNVTVAGGEKIESVLKSLKEIDPLTAKETPSGRVVDLLTSVDLFVANGDTENPIDLLDGELAPVHAPIPNDWWVKNRIDPSYLDSPQRDEDGDGFSNEEEFTAQTDPVNGEDYPLLIHKLVVKSIDSTYWLLELNSSLGDNNFQFRYNDNKGVSLRMSATSDVKIGEVFFKDGPKEGRFRVIKKLEKQVEDKGKLKKKIFATVEDLKPNKENIQFDVPMRPSAEEKKKYYRFDNTVTFMLNAVGQEGTEIVAEENTSFKITAHGKTYQYKVVEVDMGERPNLTPLAVVVEYEENELKKTRRIELN